MTLNVLAYFPWALIGPENADYEADTFALSQDGNTAVLLLPTQLERSDRFWQYDFRTGQFAALSSEAPVINAAFGQSAEISETLEMAAFTTREALLSADIDGSVADVYLRDLTTDTLSLMEPDGWARNAATELGALSDDGNWVVVLQNARTGQYEDAELMATDGSLQVDLGARLALAGIDIDADNITNVAMNDDASVIVFRQWNGEHVIYDREADSVTLLSDLAEGILFNSGVNARLTADGKYLFLHVSDAFGGEPYGLARVDLSTGTVAYVYTTDGDSQANFDISDDGRYVVFTTFQGGLVPEDPTDDALQEADVFLRDMQTGDLVLLGRGDGYGLGARFNEVLPRISGDGSRVILKANLAEQIDTVGEENYGTVFHIDGYGVWLPAIVGTDGDDDLSGGGTDEMLRGLDGDDTLSGLNGDDTLEGGDGDDLIRGGKDEDVLYGGAGEDILRGQSHGDVLYGGEDDDNVKGGGGNDTLYGDSGNDFLKGGSRKDVVYGGEGNDKLFGNSFDDTLDGGDGNDKLNAGGENDVLIGGAGDDTLKGGAGEDVFVFDTGHGDDLVNDFDAGDDTLQLSAALADGASAADIAASATVTGNGVLIEFGDSSILLKGLTATTGLEGAIDIV